MLVSVNDVRRHILLDNMASELIHMLVKKSFCCFHSFPTYSQMYFAKKYTGATMTMHVEITQTYVRVRVKFGEGAILCI